MTILASKPQSINTPDLPNNTKIRCCGCLNWTHELGGIGVWVPDRNHPVGIKYPICKQCATKVKRGGAVAKRIATTAESYLADRAKEVMAVSA